MSSYQEQDLNINGISAKDVVAFLQKHPRFFESHIDLLAEMRLPHPSGKAISLIERQVNVLRENNFRLEQKLNNLIQIARDNDRLNARIQKMALALMETRSLDDVFYSMQEILRSEFNADVVIMRLFCQPLDSHGIDASNFITRDKSLELLFSKFFQQKKPICGPLDENQAKFLFDESAINISSAALVPICDSECFGLMAIGSYDTKHFHNAMGTIFLTYIGEMIGRSLRPHMQ